MLTVRKVITEPDKLKSTLEDWINPLRKRLRLAVGTGVFARLKTAFVPLTVPLGVSASTKFAVTVPDVRLFTVVVRPATELFRLVTEVLSPDTVVFTLLTEFVRVEMELLFPLTVVVKLASEP